MLLATVTAMLLPVNTLATSYQDTYLGVSYTCYASGSFSNIYGKIVYGQSVQTMLVRTTPDVYVYKNGVWAHFAHNKHPSQLGSNTSTVTLSYTMSDFKSTYGYTYTYMKFMSCDYSFQILGVEFLSVGEIFNS